MGGTFSDRYDEEAAGDFSEPSLRVTRPRTVVVNIRPKNHRSVLPKYDISIMRPGPLGNPFRLGIDGTRDQVIVKFESYARDRIRKDAKYRALVESLRGKVLGCCCHPLKCHGDIYVKLLDEMERGEL